MRRKSIIAVLLAVCLALCGCGTPQEEKPANATATETATAATTEQRAMHYTTTAKDKSATATQAEKTAAETEETEENAEETEEETEETDEETDETAEETEPTKAAKPDSTSTSSKGFTIETIDGVTYVDGVLVANKTYDLPASYFPNGLTKECDRAYDELDAAAAEQGYILTISSGFRSYYYQEGLYNGYVASDGKSNADRYSARPGYSEHQTGLAIDLNGVSDSFGDTETGKWVAAHCHEYGFILRYPKGKEEQTGYMYEPWHIRYVGKDVAKKIYDSGLCLEEYYGITSEYAD